MGYNAKICNVTTRNVTLMCISNNMDGDIVCMISHSIIKVCVLLEVHQVLF